MKQTQKSWEFISEKYGVFHISKNSHKKFNIWWDFYDEMEGEFMEPDTIEDLLQFFKECDVRDFSDLPECGDFCSLEDTVKYLECKFGEKMIFE